MKEYKRYEVAYTNKEGERVAEDFTDVRKATLFAIKLMKENFKDIFVDVFLEDEIATGFVEAYKPVEEEGAYKLKLI